MSSEKFLGV